MITRGEYVANKKAYGVILNHTKQSSEAVLVENNTVVSAYKIDITGRYSYNNTKAKDLVELVLDGVKGCKAKNGQALPWEKGTLMEHIFTRKKVEYTVQLYRNELIGMYATKGEDTVRLERSVNAIIPKNIPYIQLTDVKKDLELSEDELDAVPVRSVEEIALEKEDVSWLKKKKYYIVNNDEDAEKLFTFLDNYNGLISYDTETTGLKINCFGKIGSSYMADLEKYNAEHPDDKVRADRLVGIIFCVEPDVSYYFPCFNRKFKNLYADKDSPVRKKIIQNIRARYTVGPGVTQNNIGDMLRYIRNTPDDELRLDVILMERVRHILETKHIVTHHGSFEWKVGWQYEIDTNLKDDSMLMHQLMYKFRSTTANSGEPSNLKYLTKVELGIEQWELKDFFPNWKEDKKGTVRMRKDEKNKGTQIDFSYMDYEGARVYAPADGDFTLQLVLKYKKDMIENHAEMLYIYDVEMLVSCAIGYMEFYGHRLNESKILGAREDTRANILMIEHEIRKSIQYNSQAENSLYEQLVDIKEQIKNETDHSKVDNNLLPKMTSICEKMREVIDNDEEHAINLSAPGQVADLFYNKLGYPMPGDKMSVAKKELKALVKERDSEGNLKYPVASLYSKYKNETTLMTKFFDNLPYFMYPGGFIFSSYGQIATATGRMSCIEENEPIMIPGGTKAIKDMQVGDLVYCYDKNNNLVIRKVTNVIDKGTRDCVEVSWRSTGCDAQGKLICTPDHRILTKTRGWVQAKDLVHKERVYHARQSDASNSVEYGADNLYIDSISTCGKRHVYDLEVEDCHNFIASELCVHNCNKPNAQQYPKVITKIVVPRDDYVMVDADYSQIEYRVLTALAKNEGLAKLFADPDSDYHTLMASLMYDVPYASVTPQMRSAAKSFNFGIPYGMGFGSLAILLTGKKNKQTIEEAKEKYEMYFKNQPKTRAFFADIKEMAQVHKYTKTLFNRYRYYTFTDKDGNINEGRKAAALRQAGNAVIQGTAADIFKISVARNFDWIRRNKLLGSVLIINMIHDEQLMEINSKQLNVVRALGDIGINMQFKIDGFPPLFIGAGCGPAWGYAKGKMAEIHPTLLQSIINSTRTMPLFKTEQVASVEEDQKKIADMVYEFRRSKVAAYLSNPENWHKVIHPAIGGLINLQFNYGRGDDAKAYVGPNGETYSDSEFLELNIADFLKENHINADAKWFSADKMVDEREEEADKEYDDSDEDETNPDEFDNDISDEVNSVYQKIEEDNSLYGSDIADLVKTFGCVALPGKHIIGFDVRGMGWRNRDALIDWLEPYTIGEDDASTSTDGAMEIAFFKEGDIFNKTGIYVAGINPADAEKQYKVIKNTKKFASVIDYKAGDIHNRSQAK